MGSTSFGTSKGPTIVDIPLGPSFSFSKSLRVESKLTLFQRVFSVRVLLVGSFAFMVIFMAAVMYGITSYSQNRITDDLSNRILYNVVKRAVDIVRTSFYYPYLATKSLVHFIPPKKNVSMAEIEQILWRQWKSSYGALQSISWSDTYGNTQTYFAANGITYHLYCDAFADNITYLYSQVNQVTGKGDQNHSQIHQPLGNLISDFLNISEHDYHKQEPTWRLGFLYRDAVFTSSNNDAVLISCLIAILDDESGELAAIATVNVVSDALRESFRTIDVSENAQVWLMEEAGEIIGSTHQENLTNGKVNAISSSSELIRETSKHLLLEAHNDVDQSFTYNLHGEKIQAFFHPMTDFNLDLHLMVAYPESDFFGVVRKLEKIILGVSASAFIFACVVGFFVMYFITAPLTRLGRQMDEISKGSFDATALDRPPSTKLLEINNLQEDFKRMATALRSFGRFVPVDIVRYLLRSNTEAVVFMNQKDMTVMFSDIKNFTRKVEEMSPAQLSLVLSDYLDTMCAVIVDTEGTVDKFIGDAIMALWNVPSQVEEHEKKACRAALESLKALASLNEKWVALDLPIVECRIGIHTGKALVGNLGSQERLAFTAVGDNVNLGARLESLNKKYGTSILISGEVYEKVKDMFLCRYLDVVVVAGRTKMTHIYELVSLLSQSTNAKRIQCADQADALNLFLERKFDEAITILNWLCDALPDDIQLIIF